MKMLLVTIVRVHLYVRVNMDILEMVTFAQVSVNNVIKKIVVFFNKWPVNSKQLAAKFRDYLQNF